MDAVAGALARHGLPREAVERFKPWFAAMTLGLLDLQAAGFRPEGGIDQAFLRRGGRPVVALESIEGQLRLFDSLSAELQEAMVGDAVVSSARAVVQLREIERAWLAGDVPALERITFAQLEEHPEWKPFYEKVVFERNRTMAASIVELHGKARHFVIVGASHLLGPDGIPALLEERGFQVERVRAVGVTTAGARTAAR
jgi:uncharacterized protein YbaP (TraB family)